MSTDVVNSTLTLVKDVSFSSPPDTHGVSLEQNLKGISFAVANVAGLLAAGIQLPTR